MRLEMKKLLFALVLFASCAFAQGPTVRSVRADTVLATHLIKKGSDTVATLADLRANSGFVPGTGDIEGIVTIWPVEGGATAGTATVTFDTTGAFAFMKYQYSLKAPLASPTFSGTVTLPSGLTGTVRVSSGVVSATASDTVGLGTALAGKLTFADSTVLLAYVKALIAAGSADSSVFATKYHVSSTYAPKASPSFTGNPTFAGSSTLKLFTGAGTLRSASDGYVSSTPSDTVGHGQVVADIYAAIEASKHVTVGQAFTYFYDDSASTIPTYNLLMPYPVSRTQHIDSALVNSTGGTLDTVFIEAYASPVAGLEDTEIAPGRWDFEFFAGTTSNTADNFLHVKVYSRTTGGTETPLFTGTTGDLTGTAIALYEIRTVQPTFTVNATDRLIVKVYAITTHNQNHYIYFTHNGTTNYSNVVTPLVTKHNNLRGLYGGTTTQRYHLDSTNATLIQAGTPNIGAATGTSLVLNGDSVLTKSRALGVKLPLVVGQYLKAVTIDSLVSAPGNVGGSGLDSTVVEGDSLYLFVAGIKYGGIHTAPTNVIDYSPVVLNGNFETLGTGSFGSWVETTSGEGTVTVDSATQYAGSYSAKMHAGTGYSVLKQSVIENGKTYTLNCRMKVNGGGDARIDFGDGNDTTITVAATWTAYTITMKASSDPLFQFVCAGSDMYIDNVRLHKDD